MIRKRQLAAAVAGALIAGLVLGSVSSGFAATAANSAPAQAVASCGLGLGGAMRDAGGRLLDVVAKATGFTTTEVAAKRAAGKSFTQIAAEKNVSANTLVGDALKVRQQVLTEKVKSGTITQSQADAALDRMKTRLTDRVADPTACTGAGMGSGGGSGAQRGAGAGGGAGGGRGARGGGACAN
jgi:hypothetical protein